MKTWIGTCMPWMLLMIMAFLPGCHSNPEIPVDAEVDVTCDDDAIPDPDDVCSRDFLDAEVPCDPGVPVTLTCRDFGHFFGRLRCDSDDGVLCGSCRSTEVIGTCSAEYPTGLAIDEQGNLYLAGYTYGPLDGRINYGNWTIFLMRISADGRRLWTRRWGELYPDDDPYKTGMSMATGVVADRWGNIYVTGFRTGGNFPYYDEVNFLSRFDGDGQLIWTREWTKEPEGYGSMEGPRSLAVDSEDNIIVCGDENGPLPGQTHQGENDLYLLKYSSDGELLWVKQWGTPQVDYCSDIEVTPENDLVIVGNTSGDMTGNGEPGLGNVFLCRFDSEGGMTWVRQWVVDDHNNAHSIALDQTGAIIVAGNTWYEDPLRGRMVYQPTLTRFDGEGNLLSFIMEEASTEAQSSFVDVKIDPEGRIIVYGQVFGSPDELTGEFNLDVFLSWYSPDLNRQGILIRGKNADEVPAELALDSSGNIFLSGDTNGPLGGRHIGSRDLFVMYLSSR